MSELSNAARLSSKSFLGFTLIVLSLTGFSFSPVSDMSAGDGMTFIVNVWSTYKPAPSIARNVIE